MICIILHIMMYLGRPTFPLHAEYTATDALTQTDTIKYPSCAMQNVTLHCNLDCFRGYDEWTGSLTFLLQA